MKYAASWEQPLENREWYYRRDPTFGVVVSVSRLNRWDEPPLFLVSYCFDPADALVNRKFIHVKSDDVNDAKVAGDKILIENGYRLIHSRLAHWV